MSLRWSMPLAVAATLVAGAAALGAPVELSAAEAATLHGAGWWECQDPISCDKQQSVHCEANFFGDCWGPMPCVRCPAAGTYWQCGFGFWDHCFVSASQPCNVPPGIEGNCDVATCACIAVPGGAARNCTGVWNTCWMSDDP